MSAALGAFSLFMLMIGELVGCGSTVVTNLEPPVIQVNVSSPACPVVLPPRFIVDAHVHSWERCYHRSPSDEDVSACAPAPRRFTPGGVLPFSTLAAEWWSKSVSFGVLVQPYFLGTDNSQILEQLAAHNNLRAVVVVHNVDGTLNDAVATTPNLEKWHTAGVRGIRLNLLGKTSGEMDVINNDLRNGASNKVLWSWMVEHDWHIEAHQEGSAWVNLIAALKATGCRIVVDHFARPEKSVNVEDPGFKAVLEAGKAGNVWMKASATHRLEVDPTVLYSYARLVKDNFGIDRILWGSDYPYTGCTGDLAKRCEDSQSFDHLLSRLRAQFPEPADQQKILTANPAFLYSIPLSSPFSP